MIKDNEIFEEIDDIEMSDLDDDCAGDSSPGAESEGEGQLYEHFRIVADAGQVPLRVDKFLFEHMQHSSRNRIQAAAEAGFIHVNGRPV